MTNGPVVLTYLDAYQKERQVSYDNIDHSLLAFSGCVTIPDSYQVVSVTYKGTPYLLLEESVTSIAI